MSEISMVLLAVAVDKLSKLKLKLCSDIFCLPEMREVHIN